METNRQNLNQASSTSLPTSPSWFTQIRSSVVPDDRPPDYDQLRISGPHRTSYQINSETDYQHNQRRISSLDVNNLESSTSQKPVEDESEDKEIVTIMLLIFDAIKISFCMLELF